MNLQYVVAEKADIPKIFDMAKALIDQYEDTSAIDYEKVLAWVSRKIETHISEYCCVQSGGQTCAYYRLCEDGELDNLYVLPAFQNRGIGAAILERCIAVSSKPLYLYVFSRNVRAISFYERFGFCVRKTVGNTRLIMTRNS